MTQDEWVALREAVVGLVFDCGMPVEEFTVAKASWWKGRSFWSYRSYLPEMVVEVSSYFERGGCGKLL